jgi:hypothetical protein
MLSFVVAALSPLLGPAMAKERPPQMSETQPVNTVDNVLMLATLKLL